MFMLKEINPCHVGVRSWQGQERSGRQMTFLVGPADEPITHRGDRISNARCITQAPSGDFATCQCAEGQNDIEHMGMLEDLTVVEITGDPDVAIEIGAVLNSLCEPNS